MERRMVETKENFGEVRSYAVLVGLRSPVLGRDSADEESLAELAALVETAGGESVGMILQGRDKPDPHSFIGEGKVEEVKQLISYGKFAPLGNRGYCASADGGWGRDACYADGMEGYMRLANERTLLIPQCETMGCLEHLEEIVALDGVAGMFIMIPVVSVVYTLARELTNKKLAGSEIDAEKLQPQPPELSSKFKEKREVNKKKQFLKKMNKKEKNK